DPEDYVHRVGRTARADSNGVAITFVNEKDKFKYANIENLIGMEIEKVALPEHLGEAPSLSSEAVNGNRLARPKNKKKKTKSGVNSHSAKAPAVAAVVDSPTERATKAPKRRQPRRGAAKTSVDQVVPAENVQKTEVSSSASKFRNRKNVREENE